MNALIEKDFIKMEELDDTILRLQNEDIQLKIEVRVIRLIQFYFIITIFSFDM